VAVLCTAMSTVNLYPVILLWTDATLDYLYSVMQWQWICPSLRVIILTPNLSSISFILCFCRLDDQDKDHEVTCSLVLELGFLLYSQV
jgi:hypothetical protein